MAFNTILSLSFFRFLLLCFHYLWNGWGAEEKMVGLKKYEMWWRGGGVAKNILHNVGKIVL